MLEPVYDIKNCGPRHRFSANGKLVHNSDKVNMQNLPRKSPLKYALRAPEGYTFIDCDSSQIEARTLAWLAGQADLVHAFEKGEDVYRIMASSIYGKPQEEITKDERFVGKTTVLGCGYGMGHIKFGVQLQTFGVVMDETECERIVSVYRRTYRSIPELWKQANAALLAMMDDKTAPLGLDGVLAVEGKDGIRLPNGLYLKYPNLRWKADDITGKKEMVYDTKAGKSVVVTRVYGGKVVENCIAGGTEVLTMRGWVSIESVRLTDKVHDGVEFVLHGGIVFKSVQACVTLDGVYMTPDHEVLTNDGWKAASQNPQPYRPDLRHVDGVEPRAQQREEKKLEISMSMRGAVHQGGHRRYQRDQTGRRPQLRMCDQAAYLQGEHTARYEQAPGVCGMAGNVSPLPPIYTSSMGKLWRSGYQCMCTMAGKVREFLVGYGANLYGWVGLGPQRQQRFVLAGKLSLDLSTQQFYEQAQYRAQNRRSGVEQTNGYLPYNAVLPSSSWVADRPAISEAKHAKPVYDIMDAGPRSRFVVKGTNGPFIVHNCCQALARIVIGEQMLAVAKKQRVVMTVHDAIGCVVPEAQAQAGLAFVEACMRIRPTWAQGLPLSCEGGSGATYGDC